MAASDEQFSLASARAYLMSECAISAWCLTTRSPCPIRHAIRCSSVAGSSAQRRQASARRARGNGSAKFAGTTEAALSASPL
jgi:hypothetical protein